MKLLVAFFSVRQTSESSKHGRVGHLWVQDTSVPCKEGVGQRAWCFDVEQCW